MPERKVVGWYEVVRQAGNHQQLSFELNSGLSTWSSGIVNVSADLSETAHILFKSTKKFLKVWEKIQDVALQLFTVLY